MTTGVSIGFPLHQFPTLAAASESNALVKLVKGPAGCLPAETEILTRSGWQSVSVPVTEAMVFDPDAMTAYFAPVEHVAYPEPDGFWRFYNHHAADMVVSDEHTVWYKTRYAMDKDGASAPWVRRSGADIGSHLASGRQLDALVPAVFDYRSDTSYPATDDELRLYVAIAADGYVPTGSGPVTVTLRKQRKKERLERLLNAAGIAFSATPHGTRPTETVYRFSPPERDKDLRRFYRCSRAQLEVIADECLHWDGHRGRNGSYFSSSLAEQADFIQFAFVMTGRPSMRTVTHYPNRPGWKSSYRATHGDRGKGRWVNLRTCKAERVPASDGMKYCLQTPTGMFVVRHNGKVFATGNSAKTSWALMELLRMALTQAPSPRDNTRYTRMLVVRNTYSLLKSNTIPSMKSMYGPLLKLTEGSQPNGRVRAKLSDGTFVDMEIQFLALDSEDAQDKLLGSQPTAVLFDELNMMPESVVFAAARRLGRYPGPNEGGITRTCILGVFNGPVKGSWLHRWWLGERDKEFEKVAQEMQKNGASVRFDKFMEFFSQPPALLRPTTEGGEWTPNPAAENIHNLGMGYGYYYAMLADPDAAKVQAYVEGDFADVKHGKVVFPEFSRDVHTFPRAQVQTRDLRQYYLSFDFGRTPVCLVSYLTQDGSLVVLDEFMGEDMSVDYFYRNIVHPALKRDYPNAVCSKAFGDPAGQQGAQSIDLSPFQVLRELGVPIVAPVAGNRLEPRLQAVRAFLGRLGMNGKPRLRIRDNCRFLIQSLAADYIYENKSGGGVRDEPTKTHVGWASDLADSLQYACLGALRIIGSEDTPQKPVEINWLG